MAQGELEARLFIATENAVTNALINESGVSRWGVTWPDAEGAELTVEARR